MVRSGDVKDKEEISISMEDHRKYSLLFFSFFILPAAYFLYTQKLIAAVVSIVFAYFWIYNHMGQMLYAWANQDKNLSLEESNGS